MALEFLSKWRSQMNTANPSGEHSASSGSSGSAVDLPNWGEFEAQAGVVDSERQLIRDGRYALFLRQDGEEWHDATLFAAAWEALEEHMALVPAGQITLGSPEGAEDVASSGASSPFVSSRETISVDAVFIDRYAVTNEDYARFVTAGGYDDMELWPEHIWPSVLKFVDQTGLPGPQRWLHGRPPAGKGKHPVVGICWYEASAYARWVGKRLPTSEEWEKAGSWPADLSGQGPKVRYPWGNSFDPDRANTWRSGWGNTVPVDEYPTGCTPNGVYQLIGNVWEWVANRYQGPDVSQGMAVRFDHPMREIRGGAFNTYLPAQVTCHFRAGIPELARRMSVGFRCALSADVLRPRRDRQSSTEVAEHWET